MDCGATCLKIIAKYFGKNYELDFLRRRSLTNKDGSSLLALSDAAEGIGLNTQGARLTWSQLRTIAPFPCIVHWRKRHFVVVYQVKRKKSIRFNGGTEDTVLVSDPAVGLLRYESEEFINNWTDTEEINNERSGVALLLSPGQKFFEEGGSDQPTGLDFTYLLKYLRPYRKELAEVMLLMILGAGLSLALPLLSQSIVDIGISDSDIAFISLILFAQVILTLSQTANNFLRSQIMLQVATRLGISLISDFLLKLMSLSMAYFEGKRLGDVIQRIRDHGRIQSFLTGTFINFIFSFFTLLVYSVLIATYDLTIFAFFYIGSVIYVLWIILFLRSRRKIDYKRFQHSSLDQGNIVQLILGMPEIKLNNCEKQKRWEWQRIQGNLFRVSFEGLRLSQIQQAGSVFIDQAKNLLITFMSAKAVISGEMTLGMMMAVQYIIGQLNAPIQQFVFLTQEAQDARMSMERLSEIQNAHFQERDNPSGIREVPANASIVIRDLSFRYPTETLDNNVLDKISLSIPANMTTAIVGRSGSGKTTLLKLLSGLYDSAQGSIEVGGIGLDYFSRAAWRANCGVVMQDGYIFSDTLRNNIALSSVTVDDAKVNRAISLANLDSFAQTLPLRLDTLIGPDGNGLSSGQRQRILIARAIYKDPLYLFLDEATNSLDSINEKLIMDSITYAFKGKTIVVIAHRLSTIKNADQIVVLDKGRVAEVGRHESLLAAKGIYYTLVREQLDKIT